MFQRGTKFYADYRDTLGQRHRKAFTSEVLALEFERAQKMQSAKLRINSPNSPKRKAQEASPTACAHGSRQKRPGPAKQRSVSSPSAGGRRPQKSASRKSSKRKA